MNTRGQIGILAVVVVFLVTLGLFATQMDFGETYDSGIAGEGDEFDVLDTPDLIPSTTNPYIFWLIIVPLIVILAAIIISLVLPW